MSYSPIIKSIITSIKSTKRATTDNNARAIIPAAIPANMLMLSPLSRCTLAPTLSIQTSAIFAVLALEECIQLQMKSLFHRSIGAQNRNHSFRHLSFPRFCLMYSLHSATGSFPLKCAQPTIAQCLLNAFLVISALMQSFGHSSVQSAQCVLS